MNKHQNMNKTDKIKPEIDKADKQLETVEVFTASNGGTLEVVGKKFDTKVMARFLLGLPQVNNADNK